jgi:tetratricopeptide (TPR) repeat protein
MFKNTFCFRPVCLFVLLLISPVYGYSQKHEADSILQLLTIAKEDSNKVKLLADLADFVYLRKPDTALIISLDALALAKRIEFDNGEYLPLMTVIAKTYSKIGNYPRALEIDFKMLEKEERRKVKDPYNLATILMSIGNVYNNEGDFRNALSYYLKSDSIIQKNKIGNLKYYSYFNIGEAYDKLNILDSAFLFYSSSKREADTLSKDYLIGPPQMGLAQVYRKQSNFMLSNSNYRSAINHLASAENDKLLCDAKLGLAMLYNAFNKPDSAIYHAKLSFQLAKKDGFPSQQLEAAKFLRQLYSQGKKIDSAFAYVMIEKDLNDTINSANRIKELQIISSNEVTRQIAMTETKKQAEKEWKNRLQQLLIGIFIPAFFLLTLLLSRVKLHIRIIRLLGILSLLFFFEYLTLLLHPTVARLTHHTPIYEIFVFVVVAAILIPLHHKAEHWLIHKLLHHRKPHVPREPVPHTEPSPNKKAT